MASNLTNTKTPNPNNPSALSPRYEIRRLEPQHSPWVNAIVMHSNAFYSPVWPIIYPENITDRLFRGFEALDYLINHQINSGLSFGVFDTEYKFKRPESEATGGKLYWDPSDKEQSIQETKGAEAEAQRLLEQMDFPLVSVAMSYDGFDQLDLEKMGPIMAVLPHFGVLYHILDERDPRTKESWVATAEGQVLLRNATATRHDYEGEKLMGATARWLMREAAAKGYKAIQIETVHDAVQHVWSKAEPPFKGTVVSSFDTATWTDEEGKLAYEPAKQFIAKIWVDLKPE